MENDICTHGISRQGYNGARLMLAFAVALVLAAVCAACTAEDWGYSVTGVEGLRTA